MANREPVAHQELRRRTINADEIAGGDGLPQTRGGAHRRRRIPLATVEQCRRELAHLYRRMDAGEIEAQQGTRQAYVIGEIIKAISIADLERRLLALEQPQHLAEQLEGGQHVVQLEGED